MPQKLTSPHDQLAYQLRPPFVKKFQNDHKLQYDPFLKAIQIRISDLIQIYEKQPMIFIACFVY